MKTSETVNAILPALVKAKSELTNPQKSATNPFFKSKYAALDDVLDHVRPVLAKQGLSVQTPAATTENGAGAGVFLAHESGEWLMFEPIILPPSKKDPQGYGAAITYAQRYALCAALGITGDPDDDGNAASTKRESSAGSKQQDTQKSKDTGSAKASPFQEALMIASKNDTSLIVEVLGANGYERAVEVPENMRKNII